MAAPRGDNETQRQTLVLGGHSTEIKKVIIHLLWITVRFKMWLKSSAVLSDDRYLSQEERLFSPHLRDESSRSSQLQFL